MRANEFTSLEDLIIQKCSIIMDSGTKLYRGRSTTLNKPFIGIIRADRIPRDSVASEAKIFDMFMEVLDWPFRKNNTLSTTNKVNQAISYAKDGDIFEVYPYNDAEYLFSHRNRDLLSIPTTILTEFAQHETNDTGPTNWAFQQHTRQTVLSDPMPILNYMRENLDLLISATGITRTSNPSDTQKSRGEVLIYGTKYVAMPLGREYIPPT